MIARLSLPWVVALALYVVRAIALWATETDRSRRLRLSPKRRQAERRLAVYAALAWPLFDLVDLAIRAIVDSPTREWR